MITSLIISVNCSFLYADNQYQDEKINVLIVTGGHDFERESFFQMFDQLKNIKYTEIKHPDANQYYEPEKADQYDVFVFYDMYNKISDQEKENLKNLLEKGKGMVFLHHSLVSYQEWQEFQEIIGGKYHQKPYTKNNKEYPGSTYKHDVKIDVKIEDPDHPVVAGLSDFTIHDEVYGQFSTTEDIQPLLSTDHPESSKYIAWVNEYANSKIVYIQLGHDHHAYENKNYQILIENAIYWVHEINANL